MKNEIYTVRLESSNELARAYKLYEKSGFKAYGRAFIKTLNI